MVPSRLAFVSGCVNIDARDLPLLFFAMFLAPHFMNFYR